MTPPVKPVASPAILHLLNAKARAEAAILGFSKSRTALSDLQKSSSALQAALTLRTQRTTTASSAPYSILAESGTFAVLNHKNGKFELESTQAFKTGDPVRLDISGGKRDFFVEVANGRDVYLYLDKGDIGKKSMAFSPLDIPPETTISPLQEKQLPGKTISLSNEIHNRPSVDKAFSAFDADMERAETSVGKSLGGDRFRLSFDEIGLSGLESRLPGLRDTISEIDRELGRRESAARLAEATISRQIGMLQGRKRFLSSLFTN